jgi:hypothetical protein
MTVSATKRPTPTTVSAQAGPPGGSLVGADRGAAVIRSLIAATALTATAVVAPLGTGTAAAESGPVPFAPTLRNCDHEFKNPIAPTGGGSGYALIGGDGGEVIAEVHVQTARPNTPYALRLIQAPRASFPGCSAGDWGVTPATLFTDGGGNATMTLRAPRQDGATGAWVYLELPSPYSMIPDEYYTSDFIAPL